MSDFWKLAGRMLRYPATSVAAGVMAFVSAAGLGAGILGLVPVMENILGENARTLPTLAREFNQKATGWGVSIPEGWIAILPTEPFETVLWMILGLGGLTAVGAAANFLHAMLSLTVSMRTVADIRRAAFRRVLRMPLSVVVKGRSSDLISRVIHDTTVLGRGFQALTDKAVAQTTRGVAAAAAALFINWRLSLITLAVAPLLAWIVRTLGKKIRRASKSAMRSQGRLLGVASEVAQGFRVVKTSTREGLEMGRFARFNREVLREQLRVRFAKALASPLIEMVTILVLGALALVAVRAILNGDLERTEFLLTLGSLAVAGSSLKPLNGVLQDLQIAEAAAQRINEVLEMPGEGARDRAMPRLGRHRQSIEFRGVRLTYEGATHPALDGVDLRIAQGETVAVVGPNGSGKTTLLSLVPRLLDPDEGAVLIDGIDIASVSMRSLRKQIGVVTQETVMFRGTIASNVAYGRRGATREMVEEAARRAHAHEFILRQPQGYDTPVGDQGLTLSGGQRQRLAIARAILRDPAILIMDEATSMVDSESEAQISQAISEFGRSRTCLIVAHRMSTVRNADRIVVMDQGRVVDVGTHAQLLERCDLYRQLAQHQLMGTEGG